MASHFRTEEQNLPPLLVPLLGDVEVVLDAVGLKVAHAGRGHGRDPAASDEKDAHERQIPNPLQGVSLGIASKSEIACRWVSDGVEFF